MSRYMLGHTVRYRTLTTIVVVRNVGGGETYITGKGKMLPLDASPAHIERLLESGLIEEVRR